MGKLKLLTISLTSGRQVFYPGEQLAGQVVVDLSEPLECRGIEIEFEGKSYCHWTETERHGDETRTVNYTGSEKLCEIELPLFGMAGGGSRVVLPAGYRTYPFLINIPPHLPSSFEGSIGHIRFTLKAKIDRPWKSDHKCIVPIIINEVIDTNLPQYNTRIGGSEHKDVGCLCCAAGPLDLTASVDRSCYCPGEQILINSDVQNKTTRDMDSVKAKLVQKISYHATNRSKTKHYSKTITKLQGAGIPEGQSAQWNNQPLSLPAIPPTIIKSRVINVAYVLEIEVAVPWGLNPTIRIPITIGTVPFRPAYGHQPQLLSQQSGILADTLPPPTYGAMAPPPSSVLGYADMAPPSYASVTGESGHICPETNINYQPVYTFAQPSQVPITQQPSAYPPPTQQQPGGYPAPPPQQPGGHPAPPPQQPGGYPAPPPQQPGGYPAPPPQQPGGYPAPPPQQPGGHPAPPPQQPGGHPAPPPQQPDGYPAPPPQQPGGYPAPPPQQPDGYPAPPPQQPGGYPAPPPQQPDGYPAPPPQQPGGYPAPQQPGGYPGAIQQQPGASAPPPPGSQMPPIEQPPYNPNEAPPIEKKSDMN